MKAKYYLLVSLTLSLPAKSVDLFDTDFIRGVDERAKVSVLQNSFVDGEYLVDLLINNRNLGRKRIVIKDINNNVCIDESVLFENKIAIKDDYYKEIVSLIDDCIYFKLESDASIKFDMLTQTLAISIPQIYLDIEKNILSDIDYGVNGFRLNYNLGYRGYSNTRYNSDKQLGFGRFSGNINVGKWVGLYNFYGDTQSGLSNVNALAFRALPEYQSSFYLGRLITQSSLQDDFSFDGLSLRSDPQMKPGNMRAYAPIVQGYANSNARVTIRQGNYVLRSESVPPGPFEYNDLHVLSNEDIVVTVEESDGEERVFNVAVTTLPNMIRHNEYEYDISIGRKLESDFSDGLFARGIYNFGLDRNTFNTEFLMNKNYYLAGAGLTRDMGEYGALSFTSSFSYANDEPSDAWYLGKSLALSYAKQLTSSTNMQIIGYRFTDKNYINFSSYNGEFMSRENQAKNYYQMVLRHTFDSKLPYVRALSFEAWQRDFWNTNDISKGGLLNISARFNYVGASLTTSYNKVNQEKGNYEISLFFDFPLDIFNNKSYINSGISYNKNTDDISYRASVSSKLSDKSHYVVSTYQSGGNNTNSLNANYDLGYTNLNLSLSDSSHSTVANARLSGSVTGITKHDRLIYDQSTSDTLAIVTAEKVNNLKVNGKELRKGNKNAGIVGLSPYRDNRLSFDASRVDEDIQLKEYNYKIKPSKYALLYQDIEYNTSYNYMLRIVNSQINVPFGAFIKDDSGARVGFVSNNSIVQLTSDRQVQFLLVEHDGADVCKINMSSIPTLSIEKKVQNVTCE